MGQHGSPHGDRALAQLGAPTSHIRIVRLVLEPEVEVSFSLDDPRDGTGTQSPSRGRLNHGMALQPSVLVCWS